LFLSSHAPYPSPSRSPQECGLLQISPDIATIPPFSSNPRRPANIPLHTLRVSSRPTSQYPSTGSRSASPSEKKLLQPDDFDSDDDFSSWSDTGDLVDQLADEEDPLRIRLNDDLDHNLPASASQSNRSSNKKRKTGKKKKQVHYASDDYQSDNEKQAGVVKRKEDIPIPNPPNRRLSPGDRLLVYIMAPNDGPSRIHGLHGKKLM
jgi:hypothetical protein